MVDQLLSAFGDKMIINSFRYGGGSDLLTFTESWWGMDDAADSTRLDSHGSNDLADTNGVGQATGIISNAADFVSANSETLSVARNSSMQLGNIDFFVATWTYTSTFLSQVIVSQIVSDASVNTIPFSLHLRGTTTTEPAIIVGNGSTGALLINTSYGVIPSNTWMFIAAWYDATADLLYIQTDNGTVDSVSYAGGSYDGVADWYFGSVNGVSTYANARVDETIFVKNYVPTEADRTWLYNSGAGRSYSDLLSYSP